MRAIFTLRDYFCDPPTSKYLRVYLFMSGVELTATTYQMGRPQSVARRSRRKEARVLVSHCSVNDKGAQLLPKTFLEPMLPSGYHVIRMIAAGITVLYSVLIP